MRKSLLFLLSAVLILPLAISCDKKSKDDESQGPEVSRVIVMGTPSYEPGFDSTGKFDLAIIAVAIDSTVIESLQTSQVSFVVDSAGYTLDDTTYTIAVQDLQFVPPAADKVAVGLLLDSSGSMSSSDPNRLRVTASKQFIRMLNAHKPTHLAAVADFSMGSGMEYYLRLLQSYIAVADTTALLAACDSAGEGNMTPLYTSLRMYLDYSDSTVSPTSYSRATLTLTDGLDNESYPEDTLGAVIAYANSVHIPCYVIGLGSYVNYWDLTRLASSTGGVYAAADSANALELIFAAMGLGLSQGYNRTGGKISPVPSPGMKLYSRVKVTSGGKEATASVVFNIPWSKK